jgi:DNA-binding NarL/FixJ family response regulator
VAAIQYLDHERRRDQEVERLVNDLTARERDVLQALAEGLSDRSIAERFSVGPATVRTHVTHILAKLEAQSRLQALVTAIRYGIVDIGSS